MSAFVVVGTVVLVVATWVGWITDRRAAAQPSLDRQETGTPPSYSIADAEGRVLANFVPRFDLEMSPRSMWQAHTPAHMIAEISATLGGTPSPEELERRFFPDAVDGEITVDAWELSARRAHLLGEWIAGGPDRDCEPIDGIWVERLGDGHSWRLVWRPLEVLSIAQRERHGYKSAWRWGRHLANGVAKCLRDPSQPEPRGSADRERARSEVWSGLIPRAGCRPIEGIASEHVIPLRDLLDREGVAAWQMRLSFGRDRVYPTGPHELFGSWGFSDPKQTESAPREGLELLCDRLLGEPVWDDLFDLSVSRYRWTQDRAVRGNRENGYLGYVPGAPAPRVESTIDLALQRFVGSTLDEVLLEHDAALAMALIVDVESGDVLAVDSRERYEIQPFAPIYHVFTTGSTLKVLTMTCAIEEGVVEPSEPIDVGYGAFRIHKDGRPTARVIHEALGAATGVIEARDAFAFSVNAGLAQIGLRIDDDAFHGYLSRLGYGKPAGSGLGSERRGHLAPLPWSYQYTHTSVCFGHEISTTAWQHTAALATVARGGVHRPLRIVRAVEQDDRRWELAPVEHERVFSESSCRTVLEMMRYGARVGTGKRVRNAMLAAAEKIPGGVGLDLGTKTGTAEKQGSELCVHVELSERKRWSDAGLPATKARYESLHSIPKSHQTSCYTSSICMFGSRDDDARRLLVFVVVEEPRGKQKFGSKVAGPAAARILAEALSLTVNGETPRGEVTEGFFASVLRVENELDEPWRVEGDEW